MTIEEAFREGLRLVREAGLPARGGDVAVLAAHAVFERASAAVQHDERFPAGGPAYAKLLILRAYASGK